MRSSLMKSADHPLFDVEDFSISLRSIAGALQMMLKGGQIWKFAFRWHFLNGEPCKIVTDLLNKFSCGKVCCVRAIFTN